MEVEKQTESKMESKRSTLIEWRMKTKRKQTKKWQKSKTYDYITLNTKIFMYLFKEEQNILLFIIIF